MIGQHLDSIHAEGAAPALLSEGKVHADGDDIDARELGRLFVETLGLQVADRSVERRHHADDAHVGAGFFQVHRRQRSVHHGEIRRMVAYLQLRPDQGQGVAFHRRCSRSFHLSSKCEL